MPYRDRLNGWAVVRLLPNFQRIVVARFRNPSDAEGHCQSLSRLMPDGKFVVVFDPPELETSPEAIDPVEQFQQNFRCGFLELFQRSD